MNMIWYYEDEDDEDDEHDEHDDDDDDEEEEDDDEVQEEEWWAMMNDGMMVMMMTRQEKERRRRRVKEERIKMRDEIDGRHAYAYVFTNMNMYVPHHRGIYERVHHVRVNRILIPSRTLIPSSKCESIISSWYMMSPPHTPTLSHTYTWHQPSQK